MSVDSIDEASAKLDQMASLAARAGNEAELAQLGVELARGLTGMDAGALVVAGVANRPEVLRNDGVSESYLEFVVKEYMNMPGARIIATGLPLVVRDALEDPRYRPFRVHYEHQGHPNSGRGGARHRPRGRKLDFVDLGDLVRGIPGQH